MIRNAENLSDNGEFKNLKRDLVAIKFDPYLNVEAM